MLPFLYTRLQSSHRHRHSHIHTQPAKPQLLSSENKMPISTHLVLLFHSSQAVCVNGYWPFSEWGRLKYVYRRQLKVKSNAVLPQVSRNEQYSFTSLNKHLWHSLANITTQHINLHLVLLKMWERTGDELLWLLFYLLGGKQKLNAQNPVKKSDATVC